MVAAVGDAQSILVFDTGPLSAFAKAGMLGLLKTLAGESRCVIVDAVTNELRAGVHIVPALQHVLEADWLVQERLVSPDEHRAFAQFAERLVGASERNLGETAVLAWVKCHGGSIAVIDDGAARKLARDESIDMCGSLRFLIDAVNRGLVADVLAGRIADELVLTGARFPFKDGEFINWARAAGHLA